MGKSTITAPLRFWLQDQVAHYPWLLQLRYWLSRQPADHLLAHDTDLLIEGFPRSANTFAAWAFMLANPGCKLAHHVHTRAHVLLAIRRRKPALILMRPPEDAVRSLLVRRLEVTPGIALRRYIGFYEGVEPYAEHLVFARFDTVINDYNRVIEAVNKRFNTQFHGLGRNIGLSEVFAAIDAANRRGHGGRVNPRHVPRPHPEREQLKKATSLAGYEQDLCVAGSVYRRLAGKAL